MKSRAPVTFLVAALVAMIGLPASAQQPSSEATRVASEVLSRSSWLAEANRCPSLVMRQQQTLDFLARNSCQPGQFDACLSKCVAGEPGACYWLGQGLHQAGVNQQAAEVLYQRSCKLGVMSGCTNRAAGMSSERREDPSVQACAVETYSKVCDFDDPWACTMYALHLSRGLGTKPDRDLALKVLGKSCKYGAEDEACIYGMRLKKELLTGSQNAQPSR